MVGGVSAQQRLTRLLGAAGFTPRSAFTLTAVCCSCSQRAASLAEANSGVTICPPQQTLRHTYTHTPLDEIMPSNSAAKASRERCRGPLTALALVLTCQCGVGQGSQSQMEVCFEAGATLKVRGIWNQTRTGNQRKRFPFLTCLRRGSARLQRKPLQVTLHTCAVLEFVFGMSSVAMAPPHNDLLFLC